MPAINLAVKGDRKQQVLKVTLDAFHMAESGVTGTTDCKQLLRENRNEGAQVGT